MTKTLPNSSKLKRLSVETSRSSSGGIFYNNRKSWGGGYRDKSREIRFFDANLMLLMVIDALRR